MKNLFFICVIYYCCLFGQNNQNIVCPSPSEPESPLEYIIPAFGPTGNLKVLVVLCKFSDDNFDLSPYTDMWPHTINQMPSWGSSIIANSLSTNYNNPSLSGYFNVMSRGDFQVIGDVVFYQPMHEQSYYYLSAGRGLGYLIEEILTNINSLVNYANYDNWDPDDKDSDGIRNEPDGQVDMIHIAFRFASTDNLDGSHYQGISGLAGFRHTFPSGTTLMFDGVSISADIRGSGIFESGVIDPNSCLDVMTHEMGHYFFGSIHYEGIGYHGLMDGNGAGIISSFEANKLGWITPTVVTSDLTDISIPDRLNSGIVYKLPINPTEYFLIDNHQRENYYESSYVKYNGGTLRSPGKGLLITHCNSSSFVDVESAFGRWDWKKNASDVYLYPLEKDIPNRIFGMDKLNLRKLTTTIGGNISDPNIEGSNEDFYNIGYNQVFSPWSNPTTCAFDGTFNNSGLELVSQEQNTGAIHINFYVGNPESAAPSKPLNLKVAYSSSNKPVLTWVPNIEPNLTGYKIYKAKMPSGTVPVYSSIATLPSTATTWTDDETIVGNPDNKVCYKITSLNSANKESVYSDTFFVDYFNSAILSSTTLSGNIVVDNNINIASGATLTIAQAAHVTFNSTSCQFTLTGNMAISGTLTIPSDCNAIVSGSGTLTLTNTGRLEIGDNATFEVANGCYMYVRCPVVVGENSQLFINTSARIYNADIPATDNSSFTFGAGSQLYIKGRGYIKHTTLDFTDEMSGGGITVDQGSCNLDTLTINRSSAVQCLNNALVNLRNSNLVNCYDGVYLYHSGARIKDCFIDNPYGSGVYGTGSSSYNPLVYNTRITKTVYNNQRDGIGIFLIDNIFPYVISNDIQGFDMGMYYGGYETIYFAEESAQSYPEKNNRMMGNTVGLEVGWGHTVWRGMVMKKMVLCVVTTAYTQMRITIYSHITMAVSMQC